MPGQSQKQKKSRRWLHTSINISISNECLSVLLFSVTKKTMFYVLQSRLKLDYTFKIEIRVLFSKIESHDVPCLILVRETLSSCIVDRSVNHSI
jgi:hypothetical protein